MKQKFYDIRKLLEQKATYNILLGERANGKSYQCKYAAVWEAYNEADYLTFLQTGKLVKKARCMIGYLRRWREEIKNKDVEKYFSDVPVEKLTNGEFNGLTCFNGDIYFTRYDEKINATIRAKNIGTAFCLTGVTHYKSLSYPKIGNIIFEEFITKDGYLSKEVDSLLDIVSTIARRDYVRLFLIGNTISRLCPYFDEWQLVNVKKQTQGTIDIYRQKTNQYDDNGKQIVINIAVEYCENSGDNSKMFFGNSAKMITTGVWESEEYPHLEKNFSFYKNLYKIAYYHESFAFVINLLIDDKNNPFVYVYPLTKDNVNIRRVITDKYSSDRLTTAYLTSVTKYDTIVLRLLDAQKVVFSDNLTGTEFMQIKKNKGKW